MPDISLAASPQAMTRREREDILKLVCTRAKLAQGALAARSAQLRLDFERRMQRTYSFDESDVWCRHAAAEAAIKKAKAEIAAEAVASDEADHTKAAVAAIEARLALKAKAIAAGSRRGAARAPGNRPVEHHANPQRRNDPTLKADWARGRQHSRARNCEVFL